MKKLRNSMKGLLIFVLIIISLVINYNVYALTPPMPIPNCYIKATVKEIIFEEEISCESIKCTMQNAAKTHPARYQVTIVVKSISGSFKENLSELLDKSLTSCNELFPRNKDAKIYIDPANKKSLTENSIIEGTISGDIWNPYLASYSITNERQPILTRILIFIRSLFSSN